MSMDHSIKNFELRGFGRQRGSLIVSQHRNTSEITPRSSELTSDFAKTRKSGFKEFRCWPERKSITGRCCVSAVINKAKSLSLLARSYIYIHTKSIADIVEIDSKKVLESSSLHNPAAYSSLSTPLSPFVRRNQDGFEFSKRHCGYLNIDKPWSSDWGKTSSQDKWF